MRKCLRRISFLVKLQTSDCSKVAELLLVNLIQDELLQMIWRSFRFWLNSLANLMNTELQFKFKCSLTGALEFPAPLIFEQRYRRETFIFLKSFDIFKDVA